MGRVAVTGANGFIGSAVVRELIRDSRDVIAIVEPGARTHNLDELNVERVACDVNDASRLRKVFGGCETVYHLAALYKTWLPDPEVIYRMNVEGTTTTLLAAREAAVRRVVYTSSIAAIGVTDGAESDETTPFNLFGVANDYMMTKWLSERVALRFTDERMSVVVVNPAFPFGPRDDGPTPTGRIILAILSGKVPGVSAGGLCAIDVDDCARGHVLAEDRGRCGQRYILGNHNVTLKELFAVTAAVGGVRMPKLPLPRPLGAAVALGMELWADLVTHAEPTATYRSIRYAQREVFFSNAKAIRELGLPTRPLEETIRRSVEWFRSAGMV